MIRKFKVPKIYFLRAPASQNGLKGKHTRLKHQSEQFWVAENPTKGGGTLKRPAPLCMFFCSQNSSNCCLRSRIFSFQSILACRGSQKLHFGDLGLTQKSNLIFTHIFCYFWGHFWSSITNWTWPFHRLISEVVFGTLLAAK